MSFERQESIYSNGIKMSAFCYLSEDKIIFYESGDLDLHSPIDIEKSSIEWRGSGRVVFQLRKSGGPGFVKNLLVDWVKQVKEV